MNDLHASSEPETRTDLAEDRTEYAADRTALANERTCSAWIRTGLAALAAGLGVARFLGGTLPEWAVEIIAAMLVLCAVAAFSFSAWRYHGLQARLQRARVRSIPFPLILMLNGVLILAAVVGLVGLWFG
ncbi:DUF202 domain-containing protein [Rhodospirillaceae bacterium SYSU D60014]|uniref:YidH family protein n=1 Tax=Virgifigura deserti TaxID=2268457 RepID=UPI0013C525F9